MEAGATIEQVSQSCRCSTLMFAHPIQCFGTFDDDQYTGTSLDNTWRLWLFQVCTEWGYFFVRFYHGGSWRATDHSLYLRMHLRRGTHALYPAY